MSVMKDLFMDDMDNALKEIKAGLVIDDTVREWTGAEFTAIEVFNDDYVNTDIFDVVIDFLKNRYTEKDALLFGDYESYAICLIDTLEDDILQYIEELIEKYAEF